MERKNPVPCPQNGEDGKITGKGPEEKALFANTQVSTSRVIHTPSAFARENLLYLQEVGSLRALAPHISRRENLPSYLFFLVKDGEGTLRYGGREYCLGPGDCVFIDCRGGYAQSTSDHRDQRGVHDKLWALSWVHFDGPTMAGIYEKYRERGGQPVFSCASPGRRERYRALLDAVFTLAAAEAYVRDMRIAEKLTELLTCLMEDAWSPAQTGVPGTKRLSVREVRAYIGEHYREKLSLDSLSKRFFINKYYLAKIFKEQYGYTVNACIAQVRIGKAKELLRFSDRTVEAIGFESGFTDPNYFARCFKKVEGISPSEYRQRW